MPKKSTSKKDAKEQSVEEFLEQFDSNRAREYIATEYPYLTQDSVTGLLMAILIEIVKLRFK